MRTNWSINSRNNVRVTNWFIRRTMLLNLSEIDWLGLELGGIGKSEKGSEDDG